MSSFCYLSTQLPPLGFGFSVGSVLGVFLGVRACNETVEQSEFGCLRVEVA